MSLIVKNLKYKYDEDLDYVLQDVSFSIEEGDIVSIIGATGSGKSTLMQCMAGILEPEGEVVCDKDIKMVFQYPEYQLFELSILKDVMFGALNKGFPEDVAKNMAIQALHKVGITDDMFELSPFEISGGQKRRVAIAGILVLEPAYLLLDEPAAGLDPISQKKMFEMFLELNKLGSTIVFISHSMEDVCEYAKNVIVLNKHKIFKTGSVIEVFQNAKELEEIGLSLPEQIQLLNKLKNKGYNVNTNLLHFNEIKECLETLL